MISSIKAKFSSLVFIFFAGIIMLYGFNSYINEQLSAAVRGAQHSGAVLSKYALLPRHTLSLQHSIDKMMNSRDTPKNISIYQNEFEQAASHLALFYKDSGALSQSSYTAQLKQKLINSKSLYDAYLPNAQQFIKKLQNPSHPELKSEYESLHAQWSAMARENEAIFDNMREELNFITSLTQDKQENLERLNLVFVILILIFIISFASYISFDVSRKIHHLISTIKKIEAGDYDAKTNIKEKDELQKIGLSLNSMSQKIKEFTHNEQKLRKTALEENEELNNSIIALLAAVDQMSKKDLTQSATVSKDVVGTIASAVNLMAVATRKTLQEIVSWAEQSESAALESREQAHKVLEFNKEAVGAAQQAILSIEETIIQIKKITQTTSSSEAMAHTTISVTTEALENVEKTQRTIEEIVRVVNTSEQRIKSLGEHAQEIGSILGIINSISEKTHILALNANMQAAQAGEAGRGFSVVAQEIQKLADQTKMATGQIVTLVENIQTQSELAIQIVNTSIENANIGLETSQQSAIKTQQALENTNRLVSFVHDLADILQTQETVNLQLRAKAQLLEQTNSLLITSAQEQLSRTDTLVQLSSQVIKNANEFKLK